MTFIQIYALISPMILVALGGLALFLAKRYIR